ncbi:spidroin-1-like [Osmerus eperlanus]|uniref:spidroin-1-like n=1 Tax=Osmerus eperlanus TaxID=29151 RepID=UPI002E124B92
MPGFGDTRLQEEETHAEIAKCVTLSAPGPHAFLLVIPLGRYTQDEARAVHKMAQIFGEGAVCDHTLVLFTHGDDLEGRGIEGYLRKEPQEELRGLVDRCGGRYHVLNNRDPGDVQQVRELLRKVESMVEENEGGFYTNAMFLEAEAAIREEQERMVLAMERGQEEGEEEAKVSKRRKCDLDWEGLRGGVGEGVSGGGVRMRGLERGGSGGEGREERRLERWTEERRGSALSLLSDRAERGWRQFEGRRGGVVSHSRRPSFRSALSRFRREAALSGKVLERVKILVAAGATGMAVGAVFGAAAPLAAAAGAAAMGNTVGFAAGQLAGMSVAGGAGMGKAVGAIVAAAAGKTAVALGAATGGLLGGSVGALAGAEAAGPGEAALDALGQVSLMGAAAVGVAAGVGGAVGAGAALGAALEGATVGVTALNGAGTAAVGAVGVANSTVAQGVGQVAALAGQHAVTTGGSVAAGAIQCAGSGAAGATVGEAVAAGGVMSDAVGTMGATARILTAVAEIGKAAAGMALAGGLVVKVVREKVRSTMDNNHSERRSYEIYWNK